MWSSRPPGMPLPLAEVSEVTQVSIVEVVQPLATGCGAGWLVTDPNARAPGQISRTALCSP
ncbi:hypothetical protein GCM10028802_33200 [Terrabacter terrigena]